MNWLLKIVEGPMRGAEIALVGGRRTSFGSGDECDIVIADASIAAKAFELDVSDDGVTVIREGAEAKALLPFEIFTVGTTAVAVGPAEGVWESLREPVPVEQPGKPEAGDESRASAGDDSSAETAGSEDAVQEGDKPAAGDAGSAEAASEKTSRKFGCLPVILAFVFLFLIAAVCAWFLRAKIFERYPQAEKACAASVETARGWWRTATVAVGIEKPVVVQPPLPTLSEIAAQHNLKLENGKLIGNVARRTERLAIRALALASDSSVKFDLTDDETLLASANEMLFVVAEGALKATAASNRIVTITGYSPTAAKFEKAVRALGADVPAIERLETGTVQIGGKAPGKIYDDSAASAVQEERAPSPEKVAVRRDYPIAGILQSPYPCIVMRNGMRLVEGAQVGAATIVRIDADKLILREGKTEFEWRP